MNMFTAKEINEDPISWSVKSAKFTLKDCHVYLSRKYFSEPYYERMTPFIADLVVSCDFTDKNGDWKSSSKIKVEEIQNVREVE
jgi:hypothetical protein